MDAIKLLVIEDDEDQRELLRETLEDYFGPGTVVGVGSRLEALAQEPGLEKKLLARVSSRELNVRQVLAKVSLWWGG